jgi:TRAP-type mannitol/chloroaromatic compound transport system substrate-binding protein
MKRPITRRNLVAQAALIVAGTLLATSAAFAQFSDRNIKITNGVNEDHPVGAGVKRMQEVLNAKAGGKMKLVAFWGGSAGNDLQATQALRAGTQEMVVTSSSPLVGARWHGRRIFQQEAGRSWFGEFSLLGKWLPQFNQQQKTGEQSRRF